MFFIVSKVLLSLVLPPSGCLIVMAIGFLIVRRRRVVGWGFIGFGFLLLYGLSTGPVSNSLIMLLETYHPPLTDRTVPADAIVVLTGGVHELSRIGLKPEPSEASLERLVEGVKLYRALRRKFIIAGGTGSLTHPEIPEADALARAASDLGVPEQDIIIENKSRNTLESAKAVKGMLKGDRILLVTSALHMKRSVALFRKQGFEIIPAPAGYRSEPGPATLLSYIPQAGNLSASSFALAEYLSYLWYEMIGDL